MITKIINNFKGITSKIYNRAVTCLNLYPMRCSCGSRGCLVRHGYYQRLLKSDSGTEKLCILRVKCKLCGRTQALLPETVIPYSQIPLNIELEMLRYRLGSQPLRNVMDRNPDITESDVLRVKSNYRKFWERRMTALGLNLFSPVCKLIRSCFSVYRRQFMQIKRGINTVP